MIVTPEFRTRIEAGKVNQGFGESPCMPVRRAAREVLWDVKSESHRQCLLLHGGDIEVRGWCDTAFRQCHEVVNGLHGPRTKILARHKLGGHDRRRKVLKHWAAVCPEAKK